MKEEDMTHKWRVMHFSGNQFVAKDPGPQFPSSWKDYIDIERMKSVAAPAPESLLHARPDYKAQAQMFDHVLKSATPVFDRTSEEGNRWRVYKVGSIEIRTIQKPEETEVIAAVFTTRPMAQSPTSGEEGPKVKDYEVLAKITMYVEKELGSLSNRRYYIVLETDPRNVGANDGITIVTEMLSDGTVTWKENPVDLEDRNSLAKAFRCKDCRGMDVIVADIKSFQEQVRTECRGIQGTSKRYAQGIFESAVGKIMYGSPFSTSTKIPQSLRYASLLMDKNLPDALGSRR